MRTSLESSLGCHLALVVALVSACGDRQAGDGDGATTGESSAEGSMTDESGSGISTETDSEGETGEPDNACSECTEDELCVANADDACGPDYGYTLHCEPKVEACVDEPCGEECLYEMCKSDYCGPPCGNVPGVDVWCAHSWTTLCDPLLQDCPEGEKCVPYASTGGSWDKNKCVAITGDGATGEACTYGGMVEASDDCDGTGMCFGVGGDPLMGTCFAFCGQGYACPDGQTCLVANDGALNLCLDTCLPHEAMACGDGSVCLWDSAGETFVCMPGVETLDPDAPCGPQDTCAAGQTCAPANELDGCADMACCTDYCDTSMPDPCTAPEACVAVFEMGQAPAGLENAGSCRLP